ncbi:hypothetical protein [Pantoea sp. V108_6]|uniref:hypothetical protein n=1 Tax=Pantoea sp. V108_6 TaxID=3044235 RepID=UPI00249F7613|nr:hypothetical protein [Pantoea sp. V108_6]MDI3365179.1 hypothetical protein [Pantoea sp. V108_6]
MPLYKFTTKKNHDNFFRTGSLRLGTIHDFKDTLKFSVGIGDKNEGHHTVSRLIDGREDFDNIRKQTLLSDIFDLPENHVVRFQNFEIKKRVVSENAYIFCTSAIFSEDIFLQWHEFSKIKGVEDEIIDSCYQILYPERFAKAISKKIEEQAYIVAANYVSYSPDPIPYDSPLKEIPPAFTKELLFSWQKEYRMMWMPNDANSLIEALFINSPEAAALCRPFATLDNGIVTMYR